MREKPGTIIIHLDQSIGELRTEGDCVTGIDFLPHICILINQLVKRDHSIILVITQVIAAEDLAAIQRETSFVAIIADTSLETAMREHKFSTDGKKALFCSTDRLNRCIAVDGLHLDAVPHLVAAEWILEGRRLFFAKVLTKRKPDTKDIGILPYYIEKVEEGWLIIGLLTDEGMIRLCQAGATADILPFNYDTSDCGFLRIDSPAELSDICREGTSILAFDRNRLLLAFSSPGTKDIVSLPHAAHGALEMLVPSPELLLPAEDPEGFARRAKGFASALHDLSPEIIETSLARVPPTQQILELPDAKTFQRDAERYSGLAAPGISLPILSRHISHPDNLRAVQELVSELSALGYYAYTQSFVHNGQTLFNVIADMPGTGYFRIKPVVLKKLLTVLRKYPRPWPWPLLKKDLARTLGKKVFMELDRKAEGQLKNKLEEIFGIYQWYPWWKLREYTIGFGSQLVIFGSHLDSTAQGSAGGYDPATDPAPGMDDNASGIAAGLAVARYLIRFKGQLVHTVRLCFFNAEEAGLVGSKAYAARMKSMNAPVKAVICADMIGYNSESNLIFEIHTGYSDPAIRNLSLPLASMVETWASSLGSLQPAQIYSGTNVATGAPDRSLYDPAINRSDHGAFHQQGYPAIVVSEDYFANLPTEPGKDPNPNYHTAKDTAIDAVYGSAIASAVACAIKELATS
ncbi:MAG TPA: M28 family metallopeptidase [Methanoregulaceae archaeon]|nr:M28 family metallopeptidase [Methanoregulaceae archaeon]